MLTATKYFAHSPDRPMFLAVYYKRLPTGLSTYFDRVYSCIFCILIVHLSIIIVCYRMFFYLTVEFFFSSFIALMRCINKLLRTRI